MPIRTVDLYRRDLAQQGLSDDRDDDLIVAEMGDIAARDNPALFDEDKDFADKYRAIREANAPSLAGEVGRGLKRGGLGLLSTTAGGMSLFTGDGWLRQKARELDEAAGAPELRATIPDVESIAPGEKSTTGKIFSKDALRYAAAKFGEAAPSLAEGVAAGVAGGAAGTLLAPGVGTIAGATEGVLERGIIRKAIRELVKQGAKTGLTEEAVVAGLKASEPAVVKVVSQTARSIGAGYGVGTSSLVSSYLQNAGDVLSDIPDRPGLAAAMGIITALPDTVLPTIIARKLFPGVALSAAKEATKEVVANKTLDLAKKLGVGAATVGWEGATEYFQEATNVVARNIRDGLDPLTFTDADLKRFREAGITGLAGGVLAAPAVAMEGRKGETVQPPPPPTTDEEFTAAAAAAKAPITGAPPRRTSAQIVGQIELMTAEEKAVRLAELQAKGQLAADEQTELDLLLAEAPPAPNLGTEQPGAPLPSPASAPLPGAPAGAPPAVGLPGQEIETAAPAMTYEEFAARYRKAFENSNRYTPDQIGSRTYTDEMAKLADDFPEYLARFEAEPPPVVAPSASTEPPVEQLKFSRRQIVDQRAVVRTLAAKAKKAAEINPKQAKKFATQLAKEQETLTEMEANKLTGPRLGVSNGPNNEPDLLSIIADNFGRIRTTPPEGTSAKGGEYKGWKDTLRSGTQKLLNGGTEGTKPDDLVQGLNDYHGFKFGSVSDLQQAIINAGAQRKKTGESMPVTKFGPPAEDERNLTYEAHIESKFMDATEIVDPITGETRAKTGGLPINQAGVGAKFKIDGENFSIIEGIPTLDFRTAPELMPTTTAEWLPVLRANVAAGVKSDKGGNRALTRIGLVLAGPNGQTVISGVVSPQYTLRSDGKREVGGLSLQQMGRGDKLRAIEAGGDRQAVLEDVLNAGWRPLAVIHFDGEPAKIFRAFPSEQQFDLAYGRTGKTAPPANILVKTEGKLTKPKLQGLERRAQRLEKEIQADIDARGLEHDKLTDEKDRAAKRLEIIALYDELNRATRVGQDQIGTTGLIDSAKGAFGPRGVDRTAPNAQRFRNANPSELSKSDQDTLDYASAFFGDKLGHPVRFTAVEPDTRQNRWEGGKGRRLPPLHADRPSLAKLRTDLERVFGKRILFFTTDLPIGSNALSPLAHPNYILVNADAPNTFTALFGHELGHDLKNQRPELYKTLSDLILGVAPMPPRYAAERYNLGYKEEDWATEYVNDVIGDRFSEPEFWTAMGREAQKAGLADKFRQLLDWIGQWLGLRSSDLAKRGDMSLDTRGNALPEIERIRNAVAAALVEFTNLQDNVQFRLDQAAIQEAQQLPIDAAHAQQFQTGVQRLRNLGGRVDLFAKEFFAQGVAAEIQKKITALEQQLPGAVPAQSNQLNRRIAQLKARLTEVGQARGAAFSPWHMALSMDDVMSADVGNVVTLLHEAAEGLALRLNPSMKGAIGRAVDQSIEELRRQTDEAATKTGAPLAKETGVIDRLAETLAQKLTAEGTPEAPSLAQAIIRWVKDLYYRTAMAMQRAFGGEPDGKMALDWFENQLRRITGGDYDFRLARLLDRYLPVPMTERARQFSGRGGTPGGMADYFNPFSRSTEQPRVIPDSADALGWNVEFQTNGLAIPDPEARARTSVAAINAVRTAMEKVYSDAGVDLPWGEWWQLVGTGDDPRTIPGTLSARFPGVELATIGGDRMTAVMNGEAALQARAWLERIETGAQTRLAKAQESIEAESDGVIAAAKEVNEIEGDRRNAQLQAAVLEKRMKDLVRKFVADYRSGLTGAVEQGRLAEAVRQAEDLLDSDPIPESYQKVFKSLLDGDVSVWDYMKAIARLELPLPDMTSAEVRKAIRDNGGENETLAALAGNKPLLVALAELARANSAQIDDINLAYLSNTEQYSKLHAELDAIRQATDDQLKTLIRTMEEKGKAATFGERIKQQYIKRRRALRTARDRVKRATDRVGAIELAQPGIADAVEQAQIDGGTAPSEWSPDDGAKWREMTYADGRWTGTTRTLRFNPDGTAANSAAILQALDQNSRYLADQQAKKGGRTWQEVYRQTTELRRIDLQQAYPAAHWHRIFKLSAPLISDLRNMGGAEGAEGVRMMDRLQFIIQSNRDAVQTLSHKWSRAWQDAQKAAGIPDNGQFQEQIYDPVSYFLNTNPGLDEDAALRQATKMARNRLTTEPAADFDARMWALLRSTKAGFEYLVKLGEQYGVFIHDDRLKSGLRNALARGWLTSMRSMDAAVVKNLTTDMQRAGWKIETKEEGGRRSVVGATTFDDLTTDETSEDASQTLDGVLQQLFTGNIRRNWLEPFINKGGTEVLKWEGEPIAQLDLQAAWADAGGNVLRWIDNVAREIDLQPLTGPEGEEVEALPAFRLSVLKQLDGLFGMEAKMAAESNQTKDLFDPQGPKPHVMIDARISDLIPPEHLNFALLDDQGARLMLSHIAFHAAFGRNGERMVTTLRNMTDKAKVRAEQYQSIKETTRGARIAHAVARGWDYKQLELAAAKVDDVTKLERVLRQFMSVGAAGSPFEEQRALMEVMNFIAGQIVDNPKTGFYDVLSAAERPLAMRSLGPATIKATARALGGGFKQALGSVLEALHLHIIHSSEAELAALHAFEQSRALPWREAVADIGAKGGQSPMDMWLYRPLKFLRYVQNKGVAFPGQGQQKDFPRLAVVPGLGVNAWMGQAAAVGNLTAQLGMLESMVRNGLRHLATHRDAAQDPAFRFKAADLGLGRWDTGVFDWWRQKAPEYGLGTLEDIVRSSQAPAAKGERLFSKDQVLRVAQMYSQELAGQSSINTMPSLLISNPLLRTAFPLLRWPFWAMHHVHEGMTTIEGRKNFASVMRGLGTLAMWNLPIGLAFTFLLDRYDEEALGRKSNLPPVGKLASLPFVGPTAEALMADRSIPDTLKAYLVRMARAGNIGGLAADVVGQFASPADSQSGRRVFSLDQRVLAMSQFLNFQQAMTNAMHQDWTTTWASVWGPLMRSVGGNAALHTLDLANNVLGLDNAEARLVMRVNASNWLRGAASELDVPLHAGGTGTPTPMSVQTRSMLTAAMAGDRIDFMEAYRKAKEQALKAVSQDPTIPPSKRDAEAEQRVLSGWRARDPLAIFAHRPTDAQLNQMLGIMQPEGAQDVRQAMRRYSEFSRLIKPSAAESAMNQQFRRMTAPPRMPRVGALF